jgi:FkbM family methyltransferase
VSDILDIDIRKYKTEYGWNFNGVRLPELDMEDKDITAMCLDSFGNIFGFTLEQLESPSREGPYVFGDFDVSPGDVVIDAGAHLGDFSAYAAFKGASKVYAFEPCNETFVLLKQTQKLYDEQLVSVNMGLSDKNEKLKFYIYPDMSGGNTIEFKSTIMTFLRTIRHLEIKRPTLYWACRPFINKMNYLNLISLDYFVQANNIEKIDFIKADIEGAERKLLNGARNVLKTMQPKLSICTYHLPDDPEVLENLIREINPNYTIVQNNKKLFAYVKGK